VRAVGWTACYDLEKHSVQQVDCLKGCPVFEGCALCVETALTDTITHIHW